MPSRQHAARAAWVGRGLSAITVLALALDGATDLLAPELLRSQMVATGFPISLAPLLGCIILSCAVLYALPRTAVIGAILVTGFYGGAICTHLRLGQVGSPPELLSVLLAVLAWGGLYLRDERIRALLPLQERG